MAPVTTRTHTCPGIGRRIAIAAASLGSAGALARAIGASRNAVSLWCRHDYIPNGYHLLRICQTTGLSADWLLGIAPDFGARPPVLADRA